jgi:hypothetical protein
MGIFRGKNVKSEQVMPIKEIEKKVEIIERPRICCLDLDADAIWKLKGLGANIYNGTLGSKVRVPNTKRREAHHLLLNYDFPTNLHEYDVVIINLAGGEIIDYKPQDHSRETHTGKSSMNLLSSYPETLFDPRPMASTILGVKLNEIKNRQFLVIVFSSGAYEVDYEPVVIKEGYEERQTINTCNIYSFWNHIPCSEAKFGTEINTVKMQGDLFSLLDKYKIGSSYNQTFYHPNIIENNQYVQDGKYVALMKNLNADIISYCEIDNNKNLFILPQFKDKTNFLIDFISKVAPTIYPKIFPYSTTFGWKHEKDYWLPNHSTLIEKKIGIQKDFERKIAEIDDDLEQNLTKYSFLHALISETGEVLVKSLISYFQWLGFEKVVDYDETSSKSGVLEEDIQIELNNGILIIECKGIGGTSTDSDCSQISKIKHRRCRARGKFDVFALYIVNHQRHMPPLKRQNSPFTDHQIQDAENDERGLLTTWQLFNLYFEIESEIITKEEARETILDFGLIDFRPKDIAFVYEPTELFGDRTICIVNVDGLELNVNEILLIEKNGKFENATILDIQENGKSIKKAIQGEFGIKLNKSIEKKSTIWKRLTNK